MKLSDDVEHILAETMVSVNKSYPAHDRNSCNDENLYNSGTVLLRHRCERCESLSKLRFARLEYECKELKALLASA